MPIQTGQPVVQVFGNVAYKRAHLVATLVHKHTQEHLAVLNGGLLLDFVIVIDRQHSLQAHQLSAPRYQKAQTFVG